MLYNAVGQTAHASTEIVSFSVGFLWGIVKEIGNMLSLLWPGNLKKMWDSMSGFVKQVWELVKEKGVSIDQILGVVFDSIGNIPKTLRQQWDTSNNFNKGSLTAATVLSIIPASKRKQAVKTLQNGVVELEKLLKGIDKGDFLVGNNGKLMRADGKSFFNEVGGVRKGTKTIAQVIADESVKVQKIVNDFVVQNKTKIQSIIDSYKPVKVKFDKQLNSISKKIGVEFKSSMIKSKESLGRKALLEYKGDFSQVNDVVRGRFVIDSVDSIDAIETLVKKNFTNVNIKNFWESPKKTGWRDITISAEINGKITEIQIVPRTLDYINDESHNLYEQWRILDKIQNPSEEIKNETIRLIQKMQKLNTDAWQKFQN